MSTTLAVMQLDVPDSWELDTTKTVKTRRPGGAIHECWREAAPENSKSSLCVPPFLVGVVEEEEEDRRPGNRSFKKERKKKEEEEEGKIGTPLVFFLASSTSYIHRSTENTQLSNWIGSGTKTEKHATLRFPLPASSNVITGGEGEGEERGRFWRTQKRIILFLRQRRRLDCRAACVCVCRSYLKRAWTPALGETQLVYQPDRLATARYFSWMRLLLLQRPDHSL